MPTPAPVPADRCSPRGSLRSPSRTLGVLVALLAALSASPRPAPAAPIYPHVPCYTGYEGNASFAQYPPSCPRGFTSHDGVTLLVSGLPVGSGIYGRMRFFDFSITSEAPGGSLGGEVTLADARVQLDLNGTGVFAGYQRTIVFPVTMTLHTGPQLPGAGVQSFPVDVFQLFGQTLTDPDFDLLRITAGTNFGLPSPGRAILTRDGTGDYLTDSFWDLRYRLDFVGDPLGPFAFMSGSTTSMHRQRAGMHTNAPCNVPDNGAGTADWTPFCGGWQTKTEALLYDDELGSFLIANMTRTPPGGLGLAPGGPFGGEQTADVEVLRLEVIGEGMLQGYYRQLSLPNLARHDLGPAMPGPIFQGRVSDPRLLLAELLGDPDFDLLRIFAGTSFALPAIGHTTLTRGGAADWMLDSFFDVTHRVEFASNPGGALAGFGGLTASDARWQGGRERPGHCLVPDNGTGTASFPPFCPIGYRSPRHVRGLLDGTPPGSPILMDLEIVPLTLLSSVPGGSLGGETQTWDAVIRIDMTGAGGFAGYLRSLAMPVSVETETAPVTLGSNPQHFETDLTQILGQIVGDPDFDLLRIAGGTSFGQPSPGHTSLTNSGGGQYNVDSFFDITYRFDFIGAAGGPFAGMSGSTNDRQRFLNGDHPTLPAPPLATPAAIAVSAAMPNPTRAGAEVMLSLPKRAAVRVAVHDLAGRLVRIVEDGTREAGLHPLQWDGEGASGARVRPGLYLMRVDADGARFARKVMVTR